MSLPVLLLALSWGIIWAAFLQYVPLGQFLVRRRTWLTVVIGVGVDLAILALALPLAQWLLVAGIFTASSVGIILRSLINEWREHTEVVTRLRGGQ